MHITPKDFIDLIILLIKRSNRTQIEGIFNQLVTIYQENMDKLTEGEQNINNIIINVIREIISTNATDKDEINIILNKHILDIANNEQLKTLFEDMTNIDLNLTEQRLEKIQNSLNQIIFCHQLTISAKRLYITLRDFQSTKDQIQRDTLIKSAKTYLSEFNLISKNHEASSATSLHSIESINFGDKEQLTQAVRTHKELVNSNFCRFGLQGLNEMNFPNPGFNLGDHILFCALSSNFKSTMLLNCARWIVEYNDFSKLTRKPLILFISLENKADKNMMWMFKKIYYNQYKDEPDITNRINSISDAEIVEFMYNYFKKKNIMMIIERFNPSNFGFNELVQLCTRYENAGFNIVSLVIDYICLMRKEKGLQTHLAIQMLVNLICNYATDKNILLLSAHQLNRDAAKLANLATDPVTKFTEDHLALSTDVHREPNILIFLHLERIASKGTYLTMNLYKNRYNEDLPLTKRYVAYKLQPGIGLADDITTEFKGYRSMHSIRNAALEENAVIKNSETKSLFI